MVWCVVWLVRTVWGPVPVMVSGWYEDFIFNFSCLVCAIFAFFARVVGGSLIRGFRQYVSLVLCLGGLSWLV